MSKKNIKFLVDESCDFVVVRSLRSAGYDVITVAESFPSASDQKVLKASVENQRVLITEDKDFGEWIFAHKKEMTGVLFIRFPGNARAKLGEAVVLLTEKHGMDLVGNFTVLEPGRARVRQYR